MRFAVFASLFVAMVTARANAQDLGGRACTLEPVPENAVLVDGQLEEWRTLHFERVGMQPNGELSYAFGYDDGGLFVAARVVDQRFVRSPFPSHQEDAVVLTWKGAGARARAREVWLFAGVPGRIRAQGSLGPGRSRMRAENGIRIVEAPAGQSSSYSFEAYIPWSVLGVSRGEALRSSRCAIRLLDIDSEARPDVVAEPSSARIDAANPDSIPRVVVHDALGDALLGLLEQRGIADSSIRIDLDGNVSGDEAVERVVVAGPVIALLSARDGQGAYTYASLDWEHGTEAVSGELVDLTGDGLLDLELHTRRAEEGAEIARVEVFVFDGGRPERVFSEVERRVGTRVTPYEGAFARKLTRNVVRGLELACDQPAPSRSSRAPRFALTWDAAARTFRSTAESVCTPR